MSRQLRLDVAQLTDVGRKRPHNEDNMAYVIPKDEDALAQKGALFIVADGMGGHAAGEVASEIAVDTVTKAYYEDENEDIPLSLINAIKRANTIIHQRADENTLRTGMGTTCVAAVLCGNIAYIANVGDSRAYIVRQTQVKQISQDHSWVEEQVRAGLLTHDQARSHAQRNVITRCLGTQTDVEVDVFPEPLSEGDTLLLCTDGLSGSISEEDLYSITHQYVPQESVYHLVERANENGGPDNITAIVVRVLELGTDTPFVRYPVPAGSHEADVDTAVLGPVSTSSLGGSSRAEERPRWSPSLEAKAGAMPLVNSSSSLSSAAEEMAQSVRRRFFYSTVALVVLIMTVLLGGGTYLIGSINHSASQLLSAHGLIDGANAALTRQDPVSALKQLATAQKVLLGAQGPLLRDQTQYNALQKSLQETFQKAVVAYNRKELITQLPCPAAHEVSLNGNVQALSLSTMRDEKGMTYWYALGTGEKLYRLDEQDHRLKDPRSFSNGARALSLAGNGQHLFALTTLSEPTAYNLSMFSYDGPPNLKEDQVAIESNLIKEGWVPAFVTAYGADVFLILVEKKAAHRTMILAYDANNWQNAPQKLQTDPLPDVVSVAAFPGKRLFFLTSDGRVKLLTFSDGGNATHAEDVLLQNPVSPPLVNEGSNFTLSTPIPTPGPEPSAGETFAQVGVTLLTVGSVGSDNPHLYMVDNPRHRIMDLKFIPGQSVPVAQTPTPGASTPSPSPTASSGAGVINPPSLKLLQQLASTTLLSSVKSATVGADGKELYLLTQGGSALTTVSSIDKAPSC